MDLRGFLAQNALKVENEKFVASKRFVNENGEPLLWEIRSLTTEEDRAVRKAATKRVPIPGKKNVFVPEVDYNDYSIKAAVTSTVFPDLENEELQNSYGVMGAEALLSQMLNPGEFTDYVSKVQEINGFNLEEEIEKAKN